MIEQKYPFVVWETRVRPDSEGAGRTRGAPGNIAVYGPLAEADPIEAHYSLDGSFNVPKGVQGRRPRPRSRRLPDRPRRRHRPPARDRGRAAHRAGAEHPLPLGRRRRGYGPPHQRPAQAVLSDVVEGYISVERAREAYGVALTGDPDRVETLRVDEAATASLRA